MLKLSVIGFFYFIFPIIVVHSNIQQEKKNILEELLDPEVYDPQIKPGNGNVTDPPMMVSVNLHIISVPEINDLKMTYTLELYFRQEWRDERLQYEHEHIDSLTLSDSHKIWVPDIFFPNEYKSYFHDIMEPNSGLTINQNGTVLSSARVTLVLRCPMHFAQFPFDKHVCSFNIESYKWDADDINFQWREPPVTVSNEMLSPLFNLDKYVTQSGVISTNTADYSRLTMSLYFSRQVKYYIVHLFIPCCLIFNVSCLACWLNPRLMTARVLIGLASLFSLALLITNFDKDSPKVPYPRAVDVFTGMCITFIFFTLIETIFVHLSESKEVENEPEANDVSDKDDIEQNEKIIHKKNAIKQMKKWLYENHQSLNDIDAASRVLFPICFVIFIVIYSITCTALNEA